MTIAANRKVLITGGASGFGLDIAREMISAGAKVALVDKSAQNLALATKELGSNALSITADVRNQAELVSAVEHANKEFKGLDTLVISAGVIHIKPMNEVSEADWDLTLDVNLKGAFFAIQAASKYLVDSGRGRIVAISSDAGKRGYSQIQAYCASKFGLIGLIESCAMELASSQVTVNCVCPVGVPTTGMGQQVANWKSQAGNLTVDQVKSTAALAFPLGRNPTEADVTKTIAFFISDEAAFLTGCALDVDGGAHLGYMPAVATK
ncbi:MAG: SDR family NAD(P)-dependent oxidoreductase [Actinobacteria bacterium]|nr:SDR family NAD(P)-dependent oxidoreductase [Actinomycetota bacterium]